MLTEAASLSIVSMTWTGDRVRQHLPSIVIITVDVENFLSFDTQYAASPSVLERVSIIYHVYTPKERIQSSLESISRDPTT